VGCTLTRLYRPASKTPLAGHVVIREPRGDTVRAAIAVARGFPCDLCAIDPTGAARQGGDESYADVAIPDAADAEAAVRSECGAGPDTIVEPVVEFPSGIDPRNGKSFAMTNPEKLAVVRIGRRGMAGLPTTNPC
jgi:hypothetical protein